MKKNGLILLTLILYIGLIHPVVAEEADTTEIIEQTDSSEEKEDTNDISSMFTDLAFRQYVVNTFGGDGKVTVENLVTITELNADNLGIQDLNGIEYFISVETVDLAGNNLGDISLHDFPKSMDYLNIQNANVTSINTEGGENIETLSINSNPLDSLDLSSLTSLINLNMGNMSPNFTVLDFTVAPSIESITIRTAYIKSLDLSQLENLDSLFISGSYTQELILPETITSKNLYAFVIDKTKIESVNYVPTSAGLWRTSNLNPVKEIQINQEGYPYIELHEDSRITNLENLNAEEENFVYDADASTLTWLSEMDPEEFYNQFNGKILFSNQASTTRTAAKPLTGYYELSILQDPVIPVEPIEPIEPTDPISPTPEQYTVNFYDCDDNLIEQAWPQEGEDVGVPSGYSYETSLMLNVTSNRDISPINCTSGYVVPATGR